MRQTDADVGTCLAGAGAGVAEADVLMSTGAHRQKRLLCCCCHCCCGFSPAEHTNDAVVVDAKPELADADADADSGGRSSPVMWMYRGCFRLGPAGERTGTSIGSTLRNAYVVIFVVGLTTSLNHHIYLWRFSSQVQITTNTCGGNRCKCNHHKYLWRKPPRVQITTSSCGENHHESNHHKSKSIQNGRLVRDSRFSVHSLQFVVCGSRLTVRGARCAVRSQFMVCGLWFAVCGLRFTRGAWRDSTWSVF